jgi:hypothetical protein
MKNKILPCFLLIAILFLSGCSIGNNKNQDNNITLRGAMIGLDVGEKDLRELASWGANHIRYQINWDTFPYSQADTATREEYSAWLEGQLKRLDGLLPVCEELSLHVVVDMHTPVCGRREKSENAQVLDFKMFQSEECQKWFIEDWAKIAKRYKGKKIIWGYDLLNEPYQGNVAQGLLDWHDLAEKTTQKIRRIDGKIRIVYEPAIDVIGKEEIKPLKYGNIAYSIHIYAPDEFTHQSINGRPHPISYPGNINNAYWNIDKLREVYKPVVDFQSKYNVPIYIGEFSVIRWAPAQDAEKYLSDIVTLLEENGWHGAYHAFREWDGWSVEHDSDYNNKNVVNYITKRKQILLDWFAKNSANTNKGKE